MTTQTEALRLADELLRARFELPYAATELRRLHAVNEELFEALCLAHDYLAGNGWDDDERINPIRAVIAAYQRKQEGKV